MADAIITEKLFDAGNYSCAKNLQEWWFKEKPEVFGIDQRPARKINLVMAHAAWNLSDYQFAVEMYKELIKRYPELESEEIRDRIWQYETLIDDGNLFPICDHPVLEPILQRLKHIYHGIKKPIRVFVAKDEADYLDFGAKHFPTLTLDPFSTLGASCFLNDPRQYWILVKEEMLNGEVSKEALTGLLAHEFAHLELFSTRVFHNYLVLKETKTFDVVINERLTDLYVISKGLAHALYQSRKELGESSDTFSAAEIAAFSKGLQKVE